MKVKISNPPMATCKHDSCDDCHVNQTLHCHAYPGGLPTLLLMVCPTFVLGGAGIYNMNGGMLIPWLVVLIGYLGLVELREIDTQPAPDAEKENVFVCRPTLRALNSWLCRAGSMTIQKRAIFISVSAFVWGHPIYFLVSGHQVFLLFAYLISATSFFVTLRRSLCSRCINFACPLNAVDDYLRSDFYECNPGVAKLWHRKNDSPQKLTGITQIGPADRVITGQMNSEV